MNKDSRKQAIVLFVKIQIVNIFMVLLLLSLLNSIIIIIIIIGIISIIIINIIIIIIIIIMLKMMFMNTTKIWTVLLTIILKKNCSFIIVFLQIIHVSTLS